MSISANCPLCKELHKKAVPLKPTRTGGGYDCTHKHSFVPVLLDNALMQSEGFRVTLGGDARVFHSASGGLVETCPHCLSAAKSAPDHGVVSEEKCPECALDAESVVRSCMLPGGKHVISCGDHRTQFQ